MEVWRFVLCVFSISGWMVLADGASCACQEPADIHFMLDASTSLGKNQFAKQLEFVKHVVSNLTIGPRDVMVGVSTYASGVRDGFWLNQHSDKASVIDAISRIEYTKGVTRCDLALASVRETAFTAEHGDRKDAKNILIFTTDGKCDKTEETQVETDLIHNEDMDIFVIAVGSNINHTQLENLNKQPRDFYSVTDFNTVDGVVSELVVSAETDKAITDLQYRNSRLTADLSTQAQTIRDLEKQLSQTTEEFNSKISFIRQELNAKTKDDDVCETSCISDLNKEIKDVVKNMIHALEYVDECNPPNSATQPCLHGTCIDKLNGYTCTCDFGWSGDECDIIVGECASNPCVHGTCTNIPNGFECTCEESWSGDTCEHQNIFLLGGDGRTYGTPIITYEDASSGNKWVGPICDDDFELEDAKVVCKMLGFQSAKSFDTENYYRLEGQYAGKYVLDDLRCKGNEASVFDCARKYDYQGIGEHNCQDSEVAAVVCDPTSRILGENDCASNPCVQGTCMDKLNGYECICDGTYSGPNCDIENVIGLMGGDGHTFGSVIVAYEDRSSGNKWVGPVCDDYWDIDDATVVCRMLGFQSALGVEKNNYYRLATDSKFHRGKYVLDNVQCTGIENSIFDCPRKHDRDYGAHDCGNSDVAGVICDPSSRIQ